MCYQITRKSLKTDADTLPAQNVYQFVEALLRRLIFSYHGLHVTCTPVFFFPEPAYQALCMKGELNQQVVYHEPLWYVFF